MKKTLIFAFLRPVKGIFSIKAAEKRTHSPVSPHAFVLRADVSGRRKTLPATTIVVPPPLSAAIPVPEHTHTRYEDKHMDHTQLNVCVCVQVCAPVRPVLPPPLLPLSRPLHVAPLSPEFVPPPPVELVIAVSHWPENTHEVTLTGDSHRKQRAATLMMTLKVTTANLSCLLSRF